MKTEELIWVLTQDSASARISMLRRVAAALAVGGSVAVLIFAATLGVRPDLSQALGTWRFLFKLLITTTSFMTAGWSCLRLSRPNTTLSDIGPALLLVPLLLLLGSGLEMATTPAPSWISRMMGNYSATCLVAIPSLSVVSLLALLMRLREGAPRSPAAAGAVAGLLAATLSASIYATHCPDDSPLFVAVWYSLAIALVALVGSLVGAKMLRW